MEVRTLTGLMKMVASTSPDQIAVSVRGKIELTYAHLRERVDEAATLLVFSGVEAGDVVALTFPNTVEFVILLLAVIRCRAIVAPLNPTYTAERFGFCLSNSGSKLLLTPQEGNQQAQFAASMLNIPHLTAKLHSAKSKITLSSINIEPSLDLMSKVVSEPSDVALFLHTSSNMSHPIPVLLTQHDLASSVQNIKRVYKLTNSDSTVIVLPMFNVYGLVAGLLSSLAAGVTVALPAAVRFSASRFWADMILYNATWYTAIPRIHQIILDHHLSKPQPAYPKLRFIMSCGALLAPSIRAQLEEAFGAPVLEAYAMMEATHLTASNPLPEDGEHKPSSVGRPVGQEMAISDEYGAIRAVGVSSEVCIGGPNVTEGHKNNPEANKQAFQSRRFHTGGVSYGGLDARFSASRSLADSAAWVSHMSEVASPSPSNDMPEGNNAPQTTEENNTETERGGEEGGHGLTMEFEKFSGPKNFSYEELMTAIADRKILGKGGFGAVYEGRIGKARTQVAVKVINYDSHQGMNEYKSEVITLSQLRHKNLVPLIGYCHEADKFVLVYEFMSEGSLDDHLFKGKSLLTWETRYKIAQGLASVLHYLQKQCRQCVIHRDIKSSNIMLDEEFEAKLGDFGLARLVDYATGSKTTKVIGTQGYMAPEYFTTSRASKETDVYSFGVVLLEIVSGRRVIDLERDPIDLIEWSWKHYRARKLVHAVDEKLGKDFDKKQAEALIIAGLLCAHPITTYRPSIEEAMAILNLKARVKPRELPLKSPQSPLSINWKVSPRWLKF
ncbi:hypothetical protein ACJRO7_019636 [Eucalyptus globulus]|uniref:Protein kinase domain-containing protein n=1 Tax=Eucalyptus globulus TaxID=34317 RepID=A0ABD3KM50_EUCGL